MMSLFSLLNQIGVPALGALLLCSAQAQDPTWVKPAPAAQSTSQQVPDPQPVVAQEPLVPVAAESPNFYVPVAGKKNKLEYIGPKTIVELPPVPLLDDEGHQRLDPAGNPIFNPPVRQQRDKHGNPVFDEHGNPVMQTAGQMGFDERGKKIREKKIKVPKTASISIERGIFTVDGMTGKAGLNYQIGNLKYIYLYAPWIGTTIVSTQPFAGATEQKNGFVDRTLTVLVEDHILQLYSDKRLLAKPRPAYVAVDRNFKLLSSYPVVGFGDTLRPPYAWPGSRENEKLRGPVTAPPLPVSLRASALMQPCPEGKMRPSASSVTSGAQTIQACVPMSSVPSIGITPNVRPASDRLGQSQ